MWAEMPFPCLDYVCETGLHEVWGGPFELGGGRSEVVRRRMVTGHAESPENDQCHSESVSGFREYPSCATLQKS